MSDMMDHGSKQWAARLPFRYCRILSSCNPNERHNGTSGGVVTAIAKYLFEEGVINSAVCYEFTGKALFQPQIAYSSQKYVQSASIYHHVPLMEFLRSNLQSLRSPVFITCLPCQCVAIRRFLRKHGMDAVLAALVCSGQLEKQATYDFLRLHKIDVSYVKTLRYRGKGWPSGIHIEMNNGKTHFFHNRDSDWKTFFHSGIYNLNRCFHCTDTFGIHADFSAADPWLKDYIAKEKEGCTVLCAAEDRWIQVAEEMQYKKLLQFHQEVSLVDFVNSQAQTVAKKESYLRFGVLRKLIAVFRTKFYRRLFLTGGYRYLHYRLYMKLLRKYKRRLCAEISHH